VVREDGRMHVLVAPEAFAGSLTAAQAAVAIADGWSRSAPGDRLTLRPMTDGGPGFVDTLSETLDGQLVAVTVRGPMGDHTPAGVLMVGRTAYVEAAQACGPHLVAGGHDPERASTYGVGELIDSARAAGASRIVVGTGGVVANDGGAGALAALGATGDVPLDHGACGPGRRRDGRPVRRCGTAAGCPGRRGDRRRRPPPGPVRHDEGACGRAWARRREGAAGGRLAGCVRGGDPGAAPAQRRPADEPGAGAGGGLGFALGCLGASRSPALEQVADLIGLPDLAGRCDLVVTGEGAYDFSSRSGSVVHHVAQVAQEALRPCVVLAGQVLVGAREMRAMGVESAYAVVDAVDSTRAHDDPAGSLAALAERVARTWSRLPG
jgi:glycerate kinase